MSDVASDENQNRDKLKLLMIPLLGIVLYWVMSDSDSTDPAGPAAVPPPTIAASPPERTSHDGADREKVRPWPALTLDEVLAHDPFDHFERIPEPEPEMLEVSLIKPDVPEVVEPEPEPLDPRELPVSVYFQSAGVTTALVNGQIMHVGDVLDDGWRVDSISKQSVTLLPPLQEDSLFRDETLRNDES